MRTVKQREKNKSVVFYLGTEEVLLSNDISYSINYLTL